YIFVVLDFSLLATELDSLDDTEFRGSEAFVPRKTTTKRIIANKIPLANIVVVLMDLSLITAT
ncbi:uncharacterized protein METZ01_LOCUS394587, partial [marine metagenome]